MSVPVANLVSVFSSDTADFSSGAKTVLGTLAKVGTAAAVVGAGLAAMSVKLASTQEDAELKLAQAQARTGNATGFTTSQLKKQAAELQNMTKFGDEVVISGQAILATFTSIKGDQFKAATEMALNLSEAFGQDLKSSAVQLGKALNDPARGISALSRVGVSFDETQKKMIKSMTEMGNVAGAQTLILDAMASQGLGGVAAAASTTFSGAMAQLKNSIGDVGESIGRQFMPFLKEMAIKVKAFLPTIKKWAESGAIQDFVKNAIKHLQNFIRTFGPPIIIAVQNVIARFQLLWAAGKAIFQALGTLFAGVGVNFGGLGDVFMSVTATITFAMKNIGAIVETSITGILLSFEKLVGTMKGIFSGGNLMKAIKTGDFKELLAREISPEERALQKSFDDQKKILSKNLAEYQVEAIAGAKGVSEKLANLLDFKLGDSSFKTTATPGGKSGSGGGGGLADDLGAKKKTRGTSEAIGKGSVEALRLLSGIKPKKNVTQEAIKKNGEEANRLLAEIPPKLDNISDKWPAFMEFSR